MTLMRRTRAILALLSAALTLVLAGGCGSATHTRAGESWEGHAQETTGAPEAGKADEEGKEGRSVEEGAAAPVAKVTTVPASPSELKGEHVEDVCHRLAKAGFTNIEPREDADLRVALLHDEGDVSRVTLVGSSRFRERGEYPPDVRVVEYHTFRNRSKRDISYDAPKESVATWVAEGQATGADGTP